jgi:hypothetical protein
MASLTNTKIKNTYVSLLKVADNGQLDAALQDITDGAGNVTGVQLNTGGDLAASGTVSFGSLKDTGENITISKFVDAADGIGSNNNDTTIPTSAAVKLYVDTNITAQDLDFTTDSGTGAVDLDSQTFSILGTANEIETSGTGQTVTIGLPSSITVDVTGNLTGNVSGNVTGNVTGDLTGNVTATSVLANGVIATTQTIGDNSTKVATTAYVDAAITAEDLDFAGDTGTGAVDLDSQTFTIAGTANEIETSASGQTITIGLPSTITANVTGNVSGNLTGSVLTAAQTNITSVGTLSSLTVAGALNGTLSTAAQTNITSVGTLSSLAVSGNLTVDTNTLFVDAANNRVGIGTTSTNTNNFLQVSKSLNDGVVASVENINTGTAAYAELQVRNSATNNTGAARLMVLGSAYTTAGGFVQDSAVLASDIDLGGGLSVMTRANADIRFYTNGHTNERMRIDASGRVGIGASPSSKLTVFEGGVSGIATVDISGGASGAGSLQLSAGKVLGTTSFDLIQNASGAFINQRDNNPLAFFVNGSERMRIDSSGRVGIGTSSPSTKLTIDESSTAATNQIDLIGNNSLAKGHIGYFTNSVYLASNYFFRSGQNNDNATLGQASMVIAAEAGGGSFAFGTSSAGSTVTTQRVRIDNDGLKFNADTAAANALDDYEEGTWTPEVTASTAPTGVTYNYQGGRYTKVGRMVSVQFGLQLSSVGTGGSGDVSITGLPFVSLNVGSYQEPSTRIFATGWTTTSYASSVYAFVNNSTTIMSFRIGQNVDSSPPYSDLQNTTSLIGHLIYYV